MEDDRAPHLGGQRIRKTAEEAPELPERTRRLRTRSLHAGERDGPPRKSRRTPDRAASQEE